MRAPYLACIRPWAEALTSSQKMNKSINKLKTVLRILEAAESILQKGYFVRKNTWRK